MSDTTTDLFSKNVPVQVIRFRKFANTLRVGLFAFLAFGILCFTQYGPYSFNRQTDQPVVLKNNSNHETAKTAAPLKHRSDGIQWSRVQLKLLPVILLLIASIGLVGNALNFIVLHAYHTSHITFGGECTARVNLIGLALADFFVCLTTLPLGYVRRRHKSFSFMLFYAIIGPGLATYFLTVSVWMVLLMSVVRYLAVCRPLTSRTCLTSRHMFRVIVVIYTLALLFHIPSFITYTYEEQTDKLGFNCTDKNVRKNMTTTIKYNLTSRVCNTSIVVTDRKFWNHQLIQICFHLMHIILGNIVPFFGVVVSNIAVIRACKKSDACRRSFTGTGVVPRPGSASAPFAPSPMLYPNAFGNGQYVQRDMNRPNSNMFLVNTNSQYRLSLQRYPNRATNRVTPLLLAVIFAFLLFTAPFGIVHFVCLHIMREMGVRVRNDTEARKLYMALNLTVEWTNAIQLLGCASNFFLYFLVSTTFRRTTKRTFQRVYQELRNCRTDLLTNIFLGKSPLSTQTWEKDTRTNELRRELDFELANRCIEQSPDIRLFYYLSNGTEDNDTSSAKNTLAQKLQHFKSQMIKKHPIRFIPNSCATVNSSPLPYTCPKSDSAIAENQSTDLNECDILPFSTNRLPLSTCSPRKRHCPECCHLMQVHYSLPNNRLLLINSPISTDIHGTDRAEASICQVHSLDK